MRPGVIAAVALAAAGAAAYAKFFRPRHLTWGASSAEAAARYAGDGIVPHPRSCATHAISIDAPPEAVWPWLAQIGQDRGGFYSYTLLENLFGCRMRNVEEIVPAWQKVRATDSVRFHPLAPRVPIAIVEEGKAFVLGDIDGGPSSWGFTLRPLEGGGTRLIVRLRSAVKGFWAAVGHFGFCEPAHFVMERKMLLTIKRLAEAHARHEYAAQPGMVPRGTPAVQ
jgi:hypothetical protein